jgi:hypothetical protein
MVYIIYISARGTAQKESDMKNTKKWSIARDIINNYTTATAVEEAVNCINHQNGTKSVNIFADGSMLIVDAGSMSMKITSRSRLPKWARQ